MQASLPQFDAAGIRIVAISVDAPEVSRTLCDTHGYTFPVLSDPALETIRRYDVAFEEEGIARPSEFLIDAGGIVRWRNLAESVYVRARPEQVLEAAKALPPRN